MPNTAVRQGRNLNCPKCREPLQVALSEGLEVDTCPKCRGIWADFVDEKALLEIKPETFTVDELRRLRRLYAPLFKKEPLQYVPCPVCNALMHRRNWGSHSGIIVDRCEKHGTWYDAKEIEKVKDFVKLGGIEYEKLRLAENGLVRLESLLDQEVLRLDKRVDSAYRRARLFSMLGF